MDKLDQFFKDKFQNREFDFKDAYWQEAEKLIQQDKRKKRRLGWWLFFGLLGALTLTMTGIWWFSTEGVIQPDRPALIQEEQKAIEKPTEIKERSALEHTENPKLASESHAVAEKTDNVDQIQAKKGKQQSNNYEQFFENERPDETLNIEQNILPIATGETTLLRLDSNQIVFEEVIEKKQLRSAQAVQKSGELESDLMIPDSMRERIKVANNEWLGVSFLPQLLTHVTSNTAEIPDAGDPLVLDHAEKLMVASKLSMGIHFNAMIYPYSSAGNERFVGLKGGIDLSYKLPNRISLETGFSLRRRVGTFGKVDETSIFYYGFSRSESTFNLLPSRLYYLEVPLGLSRSFGFHQLEVGVVSAYLAGAQGALKNVLNPELSEGLIAEDQGWIEKDGFKKIHWDLYFQYGIQYNRKLQFTVGLNYTPGSIMDKQFDRGQDFVLKESKPLFIDLGISYKLF